MGELKREGPVGAGGAALFHPLKELREPHPQAVVPAQISRFIGVTSLEHKVTVYVSLVSDFSPKGGAVEDDHQDDAPGSELAAVDVLDG